MIVIILYWVSHTCIYLLLKLELSWNLLVLQQEAADVM